MSRIFIAGFGKVGREILPWIKRRWSREQIWIIDHDPGTLSLESTLHGLAVLDDGPRFLTRYQQSISDKDWVIPALPIHLAWDWLALNLKTVYKTRSIPPEVLLGESLPYQHLTGHTLFASYADFVCPDGCPAPLGHCFKTRQKRPLPLWKFLEKQNPPKGTLHVIESRQMAPGMGGYRFGELRKALKQALENDPPFFLATACRCHGVINGLTW
ncbi:MAG TPA: hypothetical protein VK564_02475 [Thermodesulfobacteriota bacterium]|nr:hypothetical protein [Thermodesulfobacteriota bacterium]